MSTVAILIPCYNEAITISAVINAFKSDLPNAEVYVYDNCSTDNTATIAAHAGANVILAKKRGKGNVVRQMFADINADIYIMVDGDATYKSSDAIDMIKIMERDNLDMVVAVRKEKTANAYRGGHKIGNKLFNWILKILFNSSFTDIFSGYRVFSKRFVKTFPITSGGFDIEAELSIHALTLNIPFAEIESEYLERPKNSYSKLNTYTDGFKILISIIKLLKETRPLLFFGIIFLCTFCSALGLAIPVISTFFEIGLVPRLPTAVLSTGLMLISFLSLACGMILDSVSQARTEIKRLHYLRFH